MGAVANMAPDLFKAIVAEVPFVDALTTMLDDTLPLTPPEWPEWGNPIADEKAYRTIASYAPYENVVAQAYPHIFALGWIDRPARDLLGTCKVGGKTPYTEYIRQSLDAENQHGRWPWRCIGPF